ncbi:MAG: aminomethyltransferase beta-barrel domain-containing protein, partial [Gammaproteobacteria bacterium]
VDNNLLMSKRIEIDSLHKINDIDLELPLKCSVQVRHLQKPVSANLLNINGVYFIDFDEPVRAAAPGQSAVIYNENICIGGGVISKSF